MRVEHREERWAASRAEPLAEGEAKTLGGGLSSALGRAQGLGAGGQEEPRLRVGHRKTQQKVFSNLPPPALLQKNKQPRKPWGAAAAAEALAGCVCAEGTPCSRCSLGCSRRLPQKTATCEKESLLHQAPLAARCSFSLFVTFWLQLKGPRLHLEAAQALLSPASFSRDDVAVRPRLFCSSILGCCYSSSARRHPPGCCRQRRGQDLPHPHSSIALNLMGAAWAQGAAGGPWRRAACVQCLKTTSSTWGNPGVLRGSALRGSSAPKTNPQLPTHPSSPPPLPPPPPPLLSSLFPPQLCSAFRSLFARPVAFAAWEPGGCDMEATL